jgi:uncharacterized protein YdhG (YjbR/CyaY superfamily)
MSEKRFVMEAKSAAPTTVDEYIALAPPEVQPILNKIRTVIKETAPEAQERIGYQMPGYYWHGALVWFGAYAHHIGFYPTGEGMAAFKQELSGYKTSKGAVQFPLDDPIPYDMIRKIVKHRVAENLKKSISPKIIEEPHQNANSS